MLRAYGNVFAVGGRSSPYDQITGKGGRGPPYLFVRAGYPAVRCNPRFVHLRFARFAVIPESARALDVIPVDGAECPRIRAANAMHPPLAEFARSNRAATVRLRATKAGARRTAGYVGT